MRNGDESIRTYLATTPGEEVLLRFVVKPLQNSSVPPRKTPEAIISSLRERKPAILFDWFWTHDEVWAFHNAHAADIRGEDVEWYVRMLVRCMRIDRERGNSASWVERVNLFHTFGLIRLVDHKAAATVLRHDFRIGDRHGTIHNLTEMSGWNVLSMLEAREYNMSMLDALTNDPRVLMSFAEYQMFYYGGYENLLNTMKVYLRDGKRVMVPQSAAALLSWFSRNGDRRECLRIHDELVEKFPKNVRQVVENLGQSGEA